MLRSIHPLIRTLCGLLLLVSPIHLLGCTEPETSSQPVPVEEQALTLNLPDTTLVSGGTLDIEIQGAGLLEPSHIEVLFLGVLEGETTKITLQATWEDRGGILLLHLPWNALEALHPTQSTAFFNGEIQVTVDDISGTLRGIGRLTDQPLTLVNELEPTLKISSGFASLHLNEETLLDATSLLRAGEGQSLLHLDGTFTPTDGEEVPALTRFLIDTSAGRDQGMWTLEAGSFGLTPGVFVGTAQVINDHSSGQIIRSEYVDLRLRVQPTTLAGFDPPSVSRGQIIRVRGQGFIPPDAVNSRSMFFTLDGDFQTLDGQTINLRENNALQLAADEIEDHTSARLALRTETIQEPGGVLRLQGLSSLVGTFTGTVTPILVSPEETVTGESWEGTLRINPTKQVVLLKYLPGFSEALDNYGLRNVEPEIRERIQEVLQRDYTGVNIEFTDQRPDEWAEYSVIEIGGTDPNGVGLFGLDNTAGKDTRNIRLDDVIGGVNAESGELGFYVYGGVFINSFTIFSPSLNQDEGLTSPWFDTLFSPFFRDLGGSPVEAQEWPAGQRAVLIEDAIKGMGNLIGNTISHEIGHSLGLAFFPEDLQFPTEPFHNEDDLPSALMDSGLARPFEERVEVDGQGPARFTPENLEYLKLTLPIPQ